jgi:hypothetical protein
MKLLIEIENRKAKIENEIHRTGMKTTSQEREITFAKNVNRKYFTNSQNQ